MLRLEPKLTPLLVTSCGRPLTQRSPGPVKVTVQVADNATASQEFTINVGDDLAQFTVLTSIIEIDSRHEFWLSDKSRNKLLKLYEGETLKYADIEAKVARIDRRFVLLEKAGRPMAAQPR